jgi:hypothetical protein
MEKDYTEYFCRINAQSELIITKRPAYNLNLPKPSTLNLKPQTKP